jgi:hypothetical protein
MRIGCPAILAVQGGGIRSAPIRWDAHTVKHCHLTPRRRRSDRNMHQALTTLTKKGPAVASRAVKVWERMPERPFSYAATAPSSQVRNGPEWLHFLHCGRHNCRRWANFHRKYSVMTRCCGFDAKST